MDIANMEESTDVVDSMRIVDSQAKISSPRNVHSPEVSSPLTRERNEVVSCAELSPRMTISVGENSESKEACDEVRLVRTASSENSANLTYYAQQTLQSTGTLSQQTPEKAVSRTPDLTCSYSPLPHVSPGASSETTIMAKAVNVTAQERDAEHGDCHKEQHSLQIDCDPQQAVDANDDANDNKVIMAVPTYDSSSEIVITDVLVGSREADKEIKAKDLSDEMTSSPAEESSPSCDVTSLKAVPLKSLSPLKTVRATSPVKAVSPIKVVSMRAISPVKVVSPVKGGSFTKVASLVKVASPVKIVVPMKVVSPPSGSTPPADSTISAKLESSNKSVSSVKTAAVMKVASSVTVVSSAKTLSFPRVVSERANIDSADDPPSTPVKEGVVVNFQKPMSSAGWGEEEAVSSEEGAEAMSEEGDEGDSIETEPEVVTERDAGFKVNWLALRDAATGRLLWATDVDLACGDPELRVVAKVPKEILHMDAIHRELNFSTAESLDDFRLEQRVLFKGRCLEEWHFHLGSVEPTSSQTWTSVFHSTPECQLMPFETLNGHLFLSTYVNHRYPWLIPKTAMVSGRCTQHVDTSWPKLGTFC
ncbi:uncharacterized protein LOC111250292 [Varroa destructor]|uniref:GMP phosphodiesterase delta subunit domain-containing protein n=1 Tax=Varroa destructor TaxID=109461 RepID=A0A7M7K3A9_VARDE|nr:uncharacterized protein LOC111250292 [Varroa destructor]